MFRHLLFAFFVCMATSSATSALAEAGPVQSASDDRTITLANGLFALRFDAQTGVFTAARGERTFLRDGSLTEDRAPPASAKVIEVRDALGAGKAVEATWRDGRARRLAVYESLPFVCVKGEARNTTDKPLTVANVTPLTAAVDVGAPPPKLRGFGPAGPYGLTAARTHFCFAAVVRPESRAGVVCGWVTHHCASGVVSVGQKDGGLTIEGQSQYGRLTVPPGATAAGETLAIGFFDDALDGLEAYAAACAKAHQVKLPERVPSGYCTWYHAGASDQKRFVELARFAAEGLKKFGFDFVQIDDGWQLSGRDFTTYNPRGKYAGGMKPVADEVRKLGLVAGIWFIPFGWDPKCPALAERRDWFVHRPDGSIYDVYWAGSCLDMTNPQARDFLRPIIARMTRDWGYKYIKIDGLWSGMAVKILYPSPAYRPDELGTAVLHDPAKTQVEAYRDGLRLVREAAGPDVFILGCNVAQNARTLGASIGLMDGMRIGHDIGADWKAIRGGAVPPAHFYFFHKKVWFNDPDCLMLRDPLTLDQARAWGSLIAISGQMNVVSEWLPGLPPEKLDIVKRTMPNHDGLGRPIDLFEHDVPQVWHFHAVRGGQPFDVVGLFNWDDKKPAEVAVDLAKLGLVRRGSDPVRRGSDPVRRGSPTPPKGPTEGLPEGPATAPKYVGFDFWENAFLPPFSGTLAAKLRPSSCRVIAIQRAEDRPQLVSTSRHVTQGAIDVLSVQWDDAQKTLSGRSLTVAGDPYELRIVVPDGGPKTWKVAAAQVASPAPAGAKIEVTLKQDGPNVRAAIANPPGGEVEWSVSFRNE